MEGLFRVGIDFHGKGHKIQPADKIADDKIVQTHGERHNGAGHDAGGDLMERHLEKRLQGRAAQVHGRVPEGAVRLLEFRHDVQDHVGEVEGDVGNEQRPEGQAVPLPQHPGPHEDEQQGKGHAGDDIRIRHGDVGQRHGSLAQSGVQVVDAQ